MQEIDKLFSDLRKLTFKDLLRIYIIVIICIVMIIVLWHPASTGFFALIIVLMLLNLIPKYQFHQKIKSAQVIFDKHPIDATEMMKAILSKLNDQLIQAKKRPEEGHPDFKKQREIKRKMKLVKEIIEALNNI